MDLFLSKSRDIAVCSISQLVQEFFVLNVYNFKFIFNNYVRVIIRGVDITRVYLLLFIYRPIYHFVP